jgi:Flp pilus assembly protein TadG
MNNRTNHRHGVSVVYVAVAMWVLIGFCSLAVDMSRVRVAKTELENAIDAAARAAAFSSPSGVSAVQTAAYGVAHANTADGTAVTIDSINDVVFLNWPSTPLTGTARTSANAIQVTGHYAVPLLFAQALGIPTAIVHASSTAKVVFASVTYPILSLSQIDFNGGKTDSWNSALGSYVSQSHGHDGSVAADAEVTLNSPSVVNGNIYYTGTAPWNNGGTYTGSETLVSPTITATTPTTPSGCTALGGLTVSGTTTLAAGNYSSTGITVNSAGTLAVNAANGTVNLYLSGALTVNSGGLITTSGNIPNNFHIYVTNASNIQISSPCALYAVLDMPLGAFQLNQNALLYGSVVASYLTLNSGSWIHYDMALGANGGTRGATTISQVK